MSITSNATLPTRAATVAVVLAVGSLIAPRAGADTAADVDFFERKVRPVLVEHCYACHSGDAAKEKKLKAGLFVDGRDGLLKGGDSGPAVVPGDPDKSLLIRAVRYADQDLKMPPKARLPAAAVADLERWVKAGAPWPGGAAEAGPIAGATKEGVKSSGGSYAANPADHWAFKPVRPQPPPVVRDAAAAPTIIDRFVQAKLEAAGVTPVGPADRRTLIRRATFGLTGLPPTPGEVAAFVADDSPGAFERVVDRLLASSAYGERWGRHWLDLARYADSNGADENYAYPSAWRYRDYVVRSFNADKPYDRFVREQVAGDLLPAATEGERAANLTATGFLVLGPKMLAEQDKPKLVMDVVDEQIDVVGQTFLGLTLGCARCHDHKFDPVPTADYYALAGVFRSTRTMADLGHVSNWVERPLPGMPAADAAALAKWEAELAAAKAELVRLRGLQLNTIPERRQLTVARAKIQEVEKAKPAVPTAMAVEEDKPVDVPVHVRGSHLTLAAEPTPRGFLRVLDASLPRPAIDPRHSGRLELATWLADPANPLTARVMVNRVWQGHFGVGLVGSSSNFGLRGDKPTHPALLDWLAVDFVQHGWSTKRLHRQVLLSAAYQRGSGHDAAAAEADPENKLLWRQTRRRLEAEPIRDALLAVAGDLDRTVGGTLAGADGKADKYSRLKEDDPAFKSVRRAMYLPLVRTRLHELFTIFDYTDAGVHTPRRPVTTVPQQALFMLNNDLVARQAAALAAKLLAGDGPDEARVAAAYERLYARPPTEAEVGRGLAHVSTVEQTSEAGSSADRRAAAWASLCRVLLAANEFVYVN